MASRKNTSIMPNGNRQPAITRMAPELQALLLEYLSETKSYEEFFGGIYDHLATIPGWGQLSTEKQGKLIGHTINLMVM
jgi:hypothetical protein